MTKLPDGDVEVRYFPDAEAFRAWLQEHHDRVDELWVGYYKKATGKPSMTWPESVAQALCFGWIDGLRKSVDEERYRIRFTPRKRSSHWSAVNVKMFEDLRVQGLVHPAGEAAFAARDPDRTARASYEQKAPAFDAEQEAAFRANPEAWAFFQEQPPGYRRTATWWVVSAERPETRARRLATLIEDSAAGLRIKQLRRG